MQIKRYLGIVIYYKLQIYYWYVPKLYFDHAELGVVSDVNITDMAILLRE